MSEIDLGTVTVTLTPAPTAAGKPTNFRTSAFNSPEALAAEAPFPIVLPETLLDGHEFLDGALIQEPAVAAALTYVESKTGRHYIVVESPLSGGGEAAKPEVRAVGEEIAATSLGTRNAAVVVGGAPASTPRPVTLLWTKDGVLFQVTGIGYDLADLELVSQSL